MAVTRLDRLLDFLTGPQLVLGIVWLGLVGITIALLLMMVTRWGQSQPLKKCMVLSLVTHLLLATYATTVEIVAATPHEELVQTALVDEPPGELLAESNRNESQGAPTAKPWEVFSHDAPHTEQVALDRPPTMPSDEPQRQAEDVSPLLPADIAMEKLPDSELEQPRAEVDVESASVAERNEAAASEEIEAPSASRREAADLVPDRQAGPQRAQTTTPTPGPERPESSPALPGELRDVAELPRMTDLLTTTPEARMNAPNVESRARSESPLGPESVGTDSADGNQAARTRRTDELDAGVASLVRRGGAAASEAMAGASIGRSDATENPLLAPRKVRPGEPAAELPRVYEHRRAVRKAEIIASHGGSPDTEAAVKAALKWLADHQADDGRWDASEHGAGNERRVGNENFGKVGTEADTGVTGLALLAFLGNGQTHLEGDYPETVERGLAFLIDAQKSDGSLGGQADRFAMMYCHGMAALALSEAFAMTQDERLREPVRKAIGYTLSAQSDTAGGWRYQPGDPWCDTSQLGWQLMALKSAELGGLPIPEKSRQGMLRFLSNVSSDGLAKYRPLPREPYTRSMTAEALVCRQFLGLSRNHPDSNKAGDFVLGEMPGTGRANFYYWYYATLGMFQLQGKYWQQWKDALEPALISRQRGDGELAGSWDPDDVWGSHGGRVYTTALGALCLEVYYRYLPLYGNR
ncbi:MAG TPA: prenyltransferase/squalene oxidase repeat-containing protein [Pirellulales bacterium]